MRAWLVYCFAAFAAVIAIPVAFGDPMINPVPTGDICPNGGGSWMWPYPGDGPVPDGAKSIDCESEEETDCHIVPLNACINIVETLSDPYGSVDIPFDPTLPDPTPPPIFPPAPQPPLPPIVRPTAPYPTTTLPRPAGDCTEGTGYDFENFNDNTSPGAHDRGYADFQGWVGGGTPGLSP